MFSFPNFLLVALLAVVIFNGFELHLDCNSDTPFSLRIKLASNNVTDECDEIEAKADKSDDRRIAIVNGHGKNASYTYLAHVRETFENLGYKVITGAPNPSHKWDVLWYHDYAFSYEPYATMIKSGEKTKTVNHVPGSGFYTSKVQLATCGLESGVPEAYKLPSEKEDFLKTSTQHPEYFWVQKSNAHRFYLSAEFYEEFFRNIKIKKVEEMDFENGESFIQRFVDNPLLIDNRKFDIGIYTVVTSLLPLKVYIYTADVLLRFCAEDYEPFDPERVDKYVVGDDYTPIWEIPSLMKKFNQHKMTFKHTLDSYLGRRNLDSNQIWAQIGNIIAEVFRKQQANMLTSLKTANLKTKYFELSRFDFVVDEELKVFLMEANMSPNLSSGHFKQNKILYEKVLRSVFSLVGIASPLTKSAENEFESRLGDENPIVDDRELHLPLKVCDQACDKSCEASEECQLCGHCMSAHFRSVLKETYREHLDRRGMQRLNFDYSKLGPLTKEDRLLSIWTHAKCQTDSSWC